MKTSITNVDNREKYRKFYKILAAAIWILVWQDVYKRQHMDRLIFW